MLNPVARADCQLVKLFVEVVCSFVERLELAPNGLGVCTPVDGIAEGGEQIPPPLVEAAKLEPQDGGVSAGAAADQERLEHGARASTSVVHAFE